MGDALLITGTDTDVGKTVVSTLIARTLGRQGKRVGAMKPAETGWLEENEATDARILHGFTTASQQLSDVVLYRFRSPVAPAVAGMVEGEEIDLEGLVEKIGEERRRSDFLIVEGAGGLLVPLKGSYTYAELAEETQLPIVVVIGSRLGALNHAALTFEVVRRRRLALLGYVLNELYPPEIPLRTDLATASATNREMLRSIAGRYDTEELVLLPYEERLKAGMSVLREIFPDEGEVLATRIREFFGR